MRNLWLIAGRSGSGKDTLVDNLLKIHPDWTRVLSKVTRPKRGENDNYHIFTNREEYLADLQKDVVIAHNYYNENDYWATIDQLENSDLYIVDIPGIIELREKYKGNRNIKIIGIIISPEESEKRMKARGDNAEDITHRIEVDNEAFKNLSDYCDVCFYDESLSEKDMAILVDAIINIYEII